MDNQQIQPQANQSIKSENKNEYPPTIISGTSTEAEHLSVASSEPVVKPSEAQPTLHPEVHESGVRSLPSTPPITQDQINVGIQSAKESTPVITQPSGIITLPLNEQKAKEIINHDKNTQDSAVWLATLIIHELHAQALKKQGEKNESLITPNTILKEE